MMFSFRDLLSVMPGNPIITVVAKHGGVPFTDSERKDYWTDGDYDTILDMTVISLVAEYQANIKVILEEKDDISG